MSAGKILLAATATLLRRDDNENEDCVDVKPGRHGHVPLEACTAYYNYDPQHAAAVAVAVIFGILLSAHIFFAFYTKKIFSWVVIMGATWEFIAFILLSLGSVDQQQIGYAIGWQVLFLLAPLWINAYVYMTFARVAHFFQPDVKLLGMPARWITKLFVWADVVAFLVQGAGASLLSPGSVGLNVYMSGMGLQLAFIALFTSFMIRFHLNMRKNAYAKPHWKGLQFALYGVLTCIVIRLIYRLCEFANGLEPSNPLPFHEAYMYVLDAFPMMTALLLLAIFHPGRVLIGPDSEFPRTPRKEKKAAKQRKKEAKALLKEEKKAAKQEKKFGGSLTVSEV